MSISYLETAIQFSLQVQLLRQAESFDVTKLPPILGMICFLVAYPTLCAKYGYLHYPDLNQQVHMDKVGKMYSNLALWRGKQVVFYYPVFILRRLIFVLIPLLFKSHPYLQI